VTQSELARMQHSLRLALEDEKDAELFSLRTDNLQLHQQPQPANKSWSPKTREIGAQARELCRAAQRRGRQGCCCGGAGGCAGEQDL